MERRVRVKLKTFEINGEMLTAKEAEDKYGINKTTINSRYLSGYRGADLVRPTNPYSTRRNGIVHTGVKDENGNEITSLHKLGEYTDVIVDTLYNRYYINGYRGQELLDPSKSKHHTGLYDPETHEEITSLVKIAKIFNLADSTLYNRYNRGLRGMDLLYEDSKTNTEVYDEDLNELSVNDLIKILKFPHSTLWGRYSRNKRGSKLVKARQKRSDRKDD